MKQIQNELSLNNCIGDNEVQSILISLYLHLFLTIDFCKFLWNNSSLDILLAIVFLKFLPNLAINGTPIQPPPL
jgi:hypothetical protein